MGINDSADLLNYLIQELHIPQECILKSKHVPSNFEKRVKLLSNWRNVIIMDQVYPLSFFDPNDTIFLILPFAAHNLPKDWLSSLNNLTTVQLFANSVTTIGYNCFLNSTSLTSIVLPKSVITIGFYCFSNCTSLSSIVLPNTVTTMGRGCFSNCTSLTSIIIPNTVTTMGRGCFFGCISLQNVSISNQKIIPSDCFQNCRL
ncbi:MAG: hypothetical protein Ta2E_10130 [Mycoplasmoidaceae bacterium]|nr:MAG: hypothetical protein Ta2E_10130 [Mycoplasmoidaceae bacterium]